MIEGLAGVLRGVGRDTEADATVLAESPVLSNLETIIVRGFLDPPVAEILEQRFKKVEHGLG